QKDAPALRAQAEGFQAQYDALNVHDDQFDASDALIGVAVAIAAVAALTESLPALIAAWGFGGLGLIMGLAGFAAPSLRAPRAAAATPPCAPALSGDGAPISYPSPLGDSERDALTASIYGALRDPKGKGTWPEPQIAAAQLCEIASFAADGATWTLSGGS